jgi:hypothetical protein
MTYEAYVMTLVAQRLKAETRRREGRRASCINQVCHMYLVEGFMAGEEAERARAA